MAHSPSTIRIRGARQNNLKDLNLDIPGGALVVVTGVSGSGKSSLVFDTLYAEGQRRYVETFSPYARQFLDRMDRPALDHIEGIPPAIAIDQTNPVRTSRSTVGTMTEVNDHLKLLFARASHLHCRQCGREVKRDTAASIASDIQAFSHSHAGKRLYLCFPVPVPASFPVQDALDQLTAQGFTRIHTEIRRPDGDRVLHVTRDRFLLPIHDATRLQEGIDDALRLGHGLLHIWVGEADATTDHQQHLPYSTRLHCAHCDIDYADPIPSLFSFNSPIGACEACRGFGRVIGVDMGLVIPDKTKTLRDGAIKPWQTKSFNECQREMLSYAPAADVRLDTRWDLLTAKEQSWVIDGAPDWTGNWKTQWYGLRRFFDWLESRAYKMHIRVLLSRYRSYDTCPACRGTRLKPDALLWRLPLHDTTQTAAMRNWNVHELMQLPIDRLLEMLEHTFQAPWADLAQTNHRAGLQAATELVLREIISRLSFVCRVGLGYLTLDRQSRTLSGGEVQRINLTTALGTSLVNTLFVLDEPSIGLHPRDMQRVIGVMQGLRDRGNSLVVVEHDPQIMLAADHLIDMGPGPGKKGGQVVFEGAPAQIRAAQSLTADYLSGRRQVDSGLPQSVASSTPKLLLEGVRAHNLRHVSVEFPLNRLVTITGVSGSGKSTLIQDVLYPAICQALGKSSGSTAGPAGEYDRCLGVDWLSDVDFVDQSPIGKTTRSNPASVVGAFDTIRALFADLPVAKERKYSAGTFSFNAGKGRCPTCGGNGYEHIEMQFLSDVYLRCPDCDGKRFRPEVLEVVLERHGQAYSISDILALTVAEACVCFSEDAAVLRALAPLLDVGLDYLALGQPVTTLSGGEAQRLKIAAFLAQAGTRRRKPGASFKGSLLLFDEPTSGLHFDDIARLMRSLRKLQAAGHSLIVIEHNLDVIQASDWIIDLGPEGGEGGGCIVAVGTPNDVAAHPSSHTGRALREYRDQWARHDSTVLLAAEPAAPPLAPAFAQPRDAGNIEIRHAREHNLKDIDVTIPRDAFTVVTGVSGSGKSTLAFDILFNEGQRRYLESLNAYARSMVQPAARPDVDAILGIPPTVAIEQRVSRGGRKSTVATQTEIHHFLRLLFVKLGIQYCPDCQVPVQPQSEDGIVGDILTRLKGQEVGVLAPLVVNRKGLYTDLARWAATKGHTHLRVDGDYIATKPWPRLDRFREHNIDLPVGTVQVTAQTESELRTLVSEALAHGKGILEITWPLSHLRQNPEGVLPLQGMQRQVYSLHRACTCCARSFPEPDPRLFSYNSRHGWCEACFGTGVALPHFNAEDTGEEGEWLERSAEDGKVCPQCQGKRLNPTSLAIRFANQTIADLGNMTVSQAHHWVNSLSLEGREQAIAGDLLKEIASRLAFLQEVGLAYLSLDRSAPTLSGGESQRIRLAAQLGSNLQGVCYVLDEPTIGLHARDNDILLKALHQLRAHGNTLVVVEHDEATIRAADHVIDVGPGAGSRGGRVIAEGKIEVLMASPQSVTGQMLRPGAVALTGKERPIDASCEQLIVKGATLHNLKSIDVSIPLGRLVAITGVSGSGKSTLARNVLLPNLAQSLARPTTREGTQHPVGCKRLLGFEALKRTLEVDQSPIGKTPRSCTATYVGIWDEIRRIYAEAPESRMRGYGIGRFSFNNAEGRCAACEGQGVQTFEMSFLPDVKVPCELCRGLRFNRATLEVQWRGKSIGDVLAMPIDEACDFFASSRRIGTVLSLLRDLGLGYLTLGQGSPTLSGGESQRIKLVAELAKADTRAGQTTPTLYLLDEPTVGLSMADVQLLIRTLHRLVDAGHSVLVVEHNLEVIAQSDWVIDLGPDGGDRGGQINFAGTPSALRRHPGASGVALAQWHAARSLS